MSGGETVTRRDYLVDSFARSLELTGRVINWRIAATALLLSGIGALSISVVAGVWQVVVFAIYAVLVSVWAWRRRREARLVYPQLARMQHPTDIPADPSSTADLPPYMLSPADITDLDTLDRRLKLRASDRAGAFETARELNVAVLAYLVLIVAALVLLFVAVVASSRSGSGTPESGLLLYVIAVVAPIFFLYLDYTRYVSFVRQEASDTVALAEVRLRELAAVTKKSYTDGAVILWDGKDYRIDSTKMAVRTTEASAVRRAKAILPWALLVIVALFAVTYLLTAVPFV